MARDKPLLHLVRSGTHSSTEFPQALDMLLMKTRPAHRAQVWSTASTLDYTRKVVSMAQPRLLQQHKVGSLSEMSEVPPLPPATWSQLPNLLLSPTQTHQNRHSSNQLNQLLGCHGTG